MTANDLWALKIIALLHDPPDKILLGLKDHETRAESLLQRLLGRTPRAEERSLVKKADQVAAAMDRAAFPTAITVSAKDENLLAEGAALYWQMPEVRHPLAGRKLELPRMPLVNRQTVAGAYNNVIDRLISASTGDHVRLYLSLWRHLPEAVPPPWALLPPDTRMVDHSLWEHLGAASAVAASLPKPALLVFSLGPVQPFIEQARRTQDLWVGSYILSYLSWKAAQVICRRYGPDAVLYPSLRGQPLMDHWLASDPAVRLLDCAPDARRLSLATLPNKVVALVPAIKAERLAREEMVPVVRSAWNDLTVAVLNHLANLVPLDNTWRQMWSEQAGDAVRDAYWQLYWSVHPWPETRAYDDPEPYREAEEALKEYKSLSFPISHGGTPAVPCDWPFDQTFVAYCRVDKGKRVNIGTVYSRLHELAQRGFGARKGLRNFCQSAERGEKCTMCGERSALHNANDSRAAVRKDWDRLAQALQSQKRFAEVRPAGGERLCAICTVKRFAQRAIFEDRNVVGLRGGFPSTSTIASASFREKLLGTLVGLAIDHALWQVLKAFLSALRNARSLNNQRIPRTVPQGAVPRLQVLTEAFEGPECNDVKAFLKYDGDLLFPETYTVEHFKDNYGLEFDPTVLMTLRKHINDLLREAAKEHLPAPGKYFAVLLLDGDQMGAWLAGNKLPPFRNTLNTQAVALFEKQFERERLSEWKSLLDPANPNALRLVGPASHAAMSHALANFALRCVQNVVEDRYPGRVIYAGGDDLLAMLPADCALQAARELRALFSGEAEVKLASNGSFQDVRIEFDNRTSTGFLRLGEEVLLTMGPEATASVGISIAHHQAPLDGALAAVREAEKSAKDSYGRNAICVYALKRSGEALRVGSRWYYEGVTDPIGVFGELRELFHNRKLSPKLAYEASSEARALVELRGAHQSALKHLLRRHKGDQLSAVEGEQQANDWAPRLAEWAQALDVHRQQWQQWWRQHHDREPDPLDEDYAPQRGAMEMGKWLLLARFLEMGGGA